jgi:hypothetical protein
MLFESIARLAKVSESLLVLIRRHRVPCAGEELACTADKDRQLLPDRLRVELSLAAQSRAEPSGLHGNHHR